MKNDKSNCNANTPDKSMDKSFLEIANSEAGADIQIINDTIRHEAEINSGKIINNGVTENAPYSDIAEYKMVAYLDDDENEKKDDLINAQGS